MRMLTVVFALCLLPSTVRGEVELTFQDGSTMCGKYVGKYDAFCRDLGGGEVCIQKTELTSYRTVAECGEFEASGSSTTYLQKHNKTKADYIAHKHAKDPSVDLSGHKKKKATPWEDGSE